MEQLTEQESTNHPNAQQVKTQKASKGWIALSTVLFVAIIVLAVLYVNKGNTSEAVAEVNGEKITKADLYEGMISQMGDSAASLLDAMIMQKIVEIEADKAKITVTEEDIDSELNAVINEYGSKENFESALQYSGYSMDSFKEQVVMQIQLRKIFEPKIEIKDEDLKAFYEENKESYGTEEQVRASHILVGTADEAKAILDQINNGSDFAELAKQHSTDPGSKNNGGDLNFFGRGVMNAPFETASFELEIGEVSDIVQSPNGYHIIKLTDKKPATTPALDEVKEQVRISYLDQQMYAQIYEWIDEKKKELNVVNHFTANES